MGSGVGLVFDVHRVTQRQLLFLPVHSSAGPLSEPWTEDQLLRRRNSNRILAKRPHRSQAGQQGGLGAGRYDTRTRRLLPCRDAHPELRRKCHPAHRGLRRL
jgi:hypothetical protein